MGVNNGDIASKTINLIVNSTKMNTEVLKNAIKQYLDGAYTSKGKASLNKLAKGGKIEGIEISNSNIADFRRTAAKYNVQYALAKCSANGTYYVMFSAAKTANIEKAFKEYASEKVRSNDKKEFCRETQAKYRELAAERAANQKDELNRSDRNNIER